MIKYLTRKHKRTSCGASHDGLQLIVYDAPFARGHGRVVCLPPDGMVPPFEVAWRVDDKDVSHDDIGTDASRLCAQRVPPGEVTIVIVDSYGVEKTATCVVGTIELPAIVGYVATPTSSQFSRDGSVEALVENMPVNAKLLWTNGVTTSDALLKYAPCGHYSACITDEHKNRVMFIHAAAPAVVEVSPRP